MKPVYLCGPIGGRTDSECVDWREEAKKLLRPLDTLDPVRRDYRGRELEPGIPQEIVEGDIQDIRSCGALLVMFDKPSVGTAMEIRLAYAELGIPVFVVNISGQALSPWLIYHSDEVFSYLPTACFAIREASRQW